MKKALIITGSLLFLTGIGFVVWYFFIRKDASAPPVVTNDNCLTIDFVTVVKNQIQVKQDRINVIAGYGQEYSISDSLRQELADLTNDVDILKKQLLKPICGNA